MHPSPPNASLIITTYNWPEALGAVLDSVADQEVLPFEVVIADDGSGESTRATIESFQQSFPCPIRHVWHPDDGHQAAQIRNKAAMAATGDYLVFIDGDCVLRPDFIKQHLTLSRPGHFVAGNRILLSESFTEEVIDSEIRLTGHTPGSFRPGDVNRRWSLLRLPMGPLRHLNPRGWKNVKSCNMSVFGEDFLRVNGFEERFEGWGYEDSDLVVRLINAGVRRVSGRFATTVFHLWHRTNRGSLEQSNWDRFQETIANGSIEARIGIRQQTEPADRQSLR